MIDDDLQHMIEIHDRVEHRRVAGAVDRAAWIMAARIIFAPGEREPCCICGKFSSITNAHHLVPLAAQYDRGFKYPDQSFVWLCPNHHALAHKFIMEDRRSMTKAAVAARERRQGPVHDDLSENEFEKMIELMRKAARGPE